MNYIRHFGTQSADYLAFRPTYPEALFQFLSQLVTEKNVAWDCGTGNGQAAIVLAKYFEKVIATDINQEQLDAALSHKNIFYHCCPAERTSIESNSVNLTTIAQALHWFDLDKFYEEVRRVSKKNGLIAAWSYPLGTISTKIDQVIAHLYGDILKDYWPKERKYIDDGYRNIPFPFTQIQTPQFFMHQEYNLQEFIGYLKTWSAVKEYQKKNHADALEQILPSLEEAWGDVHQKRKISWPINLIVGQVHS